ncbi:GNAT family N-acetyltransferase [Bacillus sp. AFS018417]|uniref:GNAT family N-acetyltransferase n=1 Tax=Bacillus sp. AFS018417 TaxID=2033491 RepID=UPI000BFA81B6|nr:GNAT family N-acetyltransferase [Bacillus sp. AFS018417]PEZ02240.1 GNAT family N-acetyltransferase [Bacillus sp. AFS018417]
MDIETIQNAIEAHHWDYPAQLIPNEVEFIHTTDLIMIKNKNIPSIQTNKVVRFASQQPLETALRFFQNIPFSWWVPSQQKELITAIINHKFACIDEYVGVALQLSSFHIPDLPNTYSFIDVKTDEDIAKLVDVSITIWDYPPSARDNLFQQRKSYIEASGESSGYIICCDGNVAVGYANYRYSHDGSVVYLNGSGVLPTYRKQGIYKHLVYKRLQDAKEKGAILATCQARKGHSAPILEKLGFTPYETYLQFARM